MKILELSRETNPILAELGSPWNDIQLTDPRSTRRDRPGCFVIAFDSVTCEPLDLLVGISSIDIARASAFRG